MGIIATVKGYYSQMKEFNTDPVKKIKSMVIPTIEGFRDDIVVSAQDILKNPKAYLTLNVFVSLFLACAAIYNIYYIERIVLLIGCYFIFYSIIRDDEKKQKEKMEVMKAELEKVSSKNVSFVKSKLGWLKWPWIKK